jgi:hypothetical protein
MKLLVERFDSGSNDTLGRLYIDGKFYCYTLEDEKRDVKVMHETRIPEGTYKVGLVNAPSHTPRYGHEMLWIKDVPKFTGILIHMGNTENHTSGCLLVGMRIGTLNNKRAVLDSKTAYNKIYPVISEAIKRGEDVEIKYMVV